MASKYDRLSAFLADTPGTQTVFTFDEISSHVEGGLPASAHKYRVWWANEENTTHVQAMAWLNAGWRVSEVDLGSKQVTFRRS